MATNVPTPADNPELSKLLTLSAARKEGSFKPVIVTYQRELALYTFTIDAERFMELGRVQRFGDHDNGVNRRFKEAKAFAIAEAMLKPDTIFHENPFGALEGGWQFDSKTGTLLYEEGAYIVLDDGQHRRGALEVLNPDERRRWEFVFTATIDVSYDVRMKVFLQQDRRTKIDSRLKLAMQAQVGDWANEAQGRAYALCVDLAHDPRSPLKDMIILEETDKRPYEGRHRPAGINVKGLHLTFTSLMSRNSPLAQLSEEKQLEACKNIIRAASHVWAYAWKSPKHVLTTAKGINAVLKLMLGGQAFRLAVGNDFSYENLVRVFGLVDRFDWSVKRSVNEGEVTLRNRLDSAIGNKASQLLVAEADRILV